MKCVVSTLLSLLLVGTAAAQIPGSQAPFPHTQPRAPMQNADPQAPPGQGNDITNVIRDILGDTPLPFPLPPSPEGIDNIPVNVVIAQNVFAQDTNFDGEWLVVSAYAPPRLNGPQGKGELLGETRLLLRGLTPPLNVIIAAPSVVTSELTTIRIDGRIEDANGASTLISQQPTEFNGMDAAVLTLAPKPARIGTQLPPQTISKFEQMRGKVDISKPKELFRGSILTVQLTETGLVGGNTNVIKGETRLQIDQQTPPFDFTLDYGTPENGFAMPLRLSAFITDWAGRKTHVMAKPLDYSGPDFDYRLTLDAFKQGHDVANFNFTTPENAARTDIRGQAIFNAYKGLPRGSYLKVRLRSPLGPNNTPRELSTTAISLDNKAGNVDFSASAPSINFDPELPTPLIDLAIVNPSGNVLFESGASPVSETALNLITLTPSRIY